MSQSKFIIEWGSHQSPPTIPARTFLSTQASFDLKQNAPIDGSVFTPQSDTDVVSVPYIYSTTKLSYDDFEGLILAGSSRHNIGYGRVDKNVLDVNFQSGPIDWVTGNLGAFIHNFSVLARIARDAKLWGLLFDAEPYGSKVWNDYYMPSRSQFSIVRYQSEVYRVGKEIGQNLMRIWPDMNLIINKGYPDAYETIDSEPPSANSYALYPFFLDGLFDGLKDGRTVTMRSMVGRASYGKTILINGKWWHSYNTTDRQDAIDDLQGLTETRYRGNSDYFDELSFGKLLWIDLPGLEGGGVYPDFDNTTPANSHFDQDQFAEYVSFCLNQLDYVFIFNQYYNFVSNVTYSEGVINPLYTEALRAVRVTYGMP